MEALMWEFQHSVETTARPEAVWSRYADVRNWGDWDGSLEAVEAHGPFEVGTEISLTPTGQDAVRMRLVEVREPELFADETEFAGVLLRFTHRLARLDDGRTRVTHRVEVDGPGAADIGAAVTADTPDAMAALIRLAETG
jgi:hypothetical protein